MILIDMDMPESCSKCSFYDDQWDYPTCFINKSSMGYTFNPFEKRMPTCPLRNRKNEKIRQR